MQGLLDHPLKPVFSRTDRPETRAAAARAAASPGGCGVLIFFGFNSPPLGGVNLGVRGICSPAYAKISRRNLQYPAALPWGFFILGIIFAILSKIA
jgi:hypothetical protein